MSSIKKEGDEEDVSSPSSSSRFKTITEGSTIMQYPHDQELSVFYNPVQVQNRDLSILMITLYAERRAKSKALVAKKKQIRIELQTKYDEEYSMKNNGESVIDITSGKRKKNTMTKQQRKEMENEITKQYNEYEQTINGRTLIQDNKNDHGGITILDALAASGLRSIRYWKEIPGVKHVTINDLELAAVERAFDNIQCNNLVEVLINGNEEDEGAPTEDDVGMLPSQRPYGICIQQGDATHEMYMSRRPQQLRTPKVLPSNSDKDKIKTKFRPKLQEQPLKPMWDVIDLDPYGSAAPFLDSAIQGIENGGMLCITCTDMAALGGSHPETAYGRYSALPIQTAPYLQELALRILLQSIATQAAKYGRTIKPILSVGMAFYVRVFIEINNDKAGVNKLSLNIGNVYQSTKCPSFVILPNGILGGRKKNVYQSVRLPLPGVCPDTGSQYKIGGPLW